VSARKPYGAHTFLDLIVCDFCGLKMVFDTAGRVRMIRHLQTETARLKLTEGSGDD
jgi:hypothetical protein